MTMKVQAGRLTPRAAVERFQEWVYHTSHPIEALTTKNYFLGAHDRLLKGDVVEAYSFTRNTAKHLRMVVSRSDRDAVVVSPFIMSHEINEFHVYTAELSNERPAPKLATVRYDPNAPVNLELKHVKDGIYAICNGANDILVDRIEGHDRGVDLFARMQESGLTPAKAQAEADAARSEAKKSA
jgi:hypothetical protein